MTLGAGSPMMDGREVNPALHILPSSVSQMVRSGALDEALAWTADGAFVIGGDGRVILWNRSAESILGYAAKDVIGLRCCDVLFGVDNTGGRLCHEACHVKTQTELDDPVSNFDMQTRCKDGRTIWLNICILPIPGDRQMEPLTVHLFRNVTASKELLALVEEKPPESGEAPVVTQTAPLTRRELEILLLMRQGFNTAKMAERLHMSCSTVRNHVQSIFGKLKVHSRLAAVAYATQHRLL